MTTLFYLKSWSKKPSLFERLGFSYERAEDERESSYTVAAICRAWAIQKA